MENRLHTSNIIIKDSPVKFLSGLLRKVSIIWLILSLFVQFFTDYWYIVPILIIISYVLIKNWKGILIISCFYSLVYLVSSLFGDIGTKIMFLIIIGIMIYNYRKISKLLNFDETEKEVKQKVAAMQLGLAKKYIKKGQYVDPKLIKNLEDATNGIFK